MPSSTQVAIVTGSGGTGCGRGIALLFAAEGWAVVVSDINSAGGRETAQLIQQRGGRAAFCPADVTDEAQVRSLIYFAETTFGALSVLVNNASSPHPTEEGIAGWTASIQTDLLGALHTTRYAIDAIKRSGGGSIVNIASISALWHGRRTPGGFSGYDVAKLGVIRMTTGLSKELADSGIRFNCLAPGWIATDGPRQYWESLTPEQRLERGVPSKLLSVDAVAGIVFRIATDPSLNGRIVVWWSEDEPRLIEWGDRGYQSFAPF